MTDSFLITCEHGGNRIPLPYGRLFAGQRAVLNSHRGYDPGALAMARTLARSLRAPLVASTVSRLLVDLNRSPGNPQRFSEITRNTPANVREEIARKNYIPYRTEVERLVGQAVKFHGRVIHISSHSFTPVLRDSVRRADVGLLYDPGRAGEAALCARWKAALAAVCPQLAVRRNYPYAGKGDGLTAYLRRRFPQRAYVGIELEINQRIVFAAGPAWVALRRTLVNALRTACMQRIGAK